jgi:hypothetical protein
MTIKTLSAAVAVIGILQVGSLRGQSAGEMWGVNSANEIFRWTGAGWEHIPGQLKYVSIGTDGAVWGVNTGDQIFRWTGSGFQLVPNGALKQIAVGTAVDIWGVNANNEVFRSSGAGAGWHQISGSLKYVSVGGDGSVWGVNSRDEIYRWSGKEFVLVPNGGLKLLSVSEANDVWGINSQNEIFSRQLEPSPVYRKTLSLLQPIVISVLLPRVSSEYQYERLRGRRRDTALLLPTEHGMDIIPAVASETCWGRSQAATSISTCSPGAISAINFSFQFKG